MTDLKTLIHETHDFPTKGVLFRDLSPVLRYALPQSLEALEKLLTPDEWNQIDAIAGIDARGFALGAALAAHRHKGFILIRKAGKLPPPVERFTYQLEYGSATLEMKKGEGRVLLIDDVLATGGTLNAAAQLCRRSGHDLRAIIVLADLCLPGRPASIDGMPIRSAVSYAPSLPR